MNDMNICKTITRPVPFFAMFFVGVMATTIGAQFAAAQVDQAKANPSQPNIVFIFADDWGWGDLSCHGHRYLKTPNIDKLAATGTEFYQFTVASGVCSPSRAAVMTGQFPARHSIHGHFATVASHQKRGMPDWLDPKTVLLPRLLKQAGYATAHYGKWHLTNIMVPDAPLPLAYGYDDYGAFNCSGPQMPVHDDVPRAIKFIQKSVAAGKPFFINLWIHEPHTPHYPKLEFLKKFAHLKEPDQIYAAVLAHADARIGQLLATLDQLKLSDNTLVIFTSDNGPERTGTKRKTDDRSTGPGIGTIASVGTTGGHRGRKRSLLQGGVGVPFIARWPGKIAANKVDDTTPLTAVDLLPTLCAIAGVKLPAGYTSDGVDQSAALLGIPGARREAIKRQSPIFWQWRYASSSGTNWPALAIRQGDWKMLIGKKNQRIELFRFPSDRLEKTDLSAKHAGEVARLRSLISNWEKTIPAKPNEACFSKTRQK
jgi:arylsulfatase A-like enzyme